MNFLRQVARYYLRKQSQGISLGQYTMVLPNKRSARFLSKYIRQEMGQTAFMPRLCTITSFIQECAPAVLASQTEQLFLLYETYCSVAREMGRGEQIADFDKFIYWGAVLLEDFGLVDAEMVDANQLFKNIRDERSIESYYLTRPQISAARKLGIRRHLLYNPDEFWKHTKPSEPKADTNAEKFLRIWEMLPAIYTLFREKLAEKGMAYSGMQARMAAEQIRNFDAEDFGSERIVFVGFYVLSEARRRVLWHLKTLGIADFFWDTAAPILYESGCKAASNIIELADSFPAPEDFQLEKISNESPIELCPVTSNIAQAKVAAHILDEWRKDGSLNSTAVILPNEKLLAPLLTSLPPEIGDYNIAMRLSFGNTPFAALINAILRMQQNAQLRLNELHYFYKDVLEVLSHPLVTHYMPNETKAIKEDIRLRHLFRISALELEKEYPGMAFIFHPIAKANNVDEICTYLISLFDNLSLKLKLPDINGEGKIIPYEGKIIEAYRDKVVEISRLAKEYNVGMAHTSFFTLLRKILAAQDIDFDGNPVTGLQILGIQDSRVLDFDRLIICSLNERIMPPAVSKPSFLPPAIRRCYGIPTLEEEERNTAYLFYRLISRTQNLCLTYDNRPADLAVGETSRYVKQLQIMHPERIVVRPVKMGLSPGEKYSLRIRKDETVMTELQAYFEPEGCALSASTLKTFLKCPLRFYLSAVKGLNTDSFDPSFIDAASYGTIVHTVAQDFYQSHGTSQLFDLAFYEAMLQQPTLYGNLRNRALETIDKVYYYGKYAKALNLLPSEARIHGKMIARDIISMLKAERELISKGILKPFYFHSAEFTGSPDGKRKKLRWKVDNDLTINFTMSIDRIDREAETGKLRFIDYKTGSDTVKACSMADVFSGNYNVIFQLLTYAMAYSDIFEPKAQIQPFAYLFNQMSKPEEGIQSFKIDEIEVSSLLLVQENFREKFKALIQRIFSPEEDFYPTDDLETCKKCPFTELCGKNLPKDN